jgi:hypothetical protein
MRRRDSRTWTAALLLAVVLLAAGASWLFWNAGVHREAERGGANAAQAARDSIVAISSYQPATVGETLGAAARDRLTGKFFDDYTQLVKTVVAPESIAKKITAAATVPAVAVVSADPGEGHVHGAGDDGQRRRPLADLRFRADLRRTPWASTRSPNRAGSTSARPRCSCVR